MKPRKWIIVFAVFAFLCGSVVYEGLTFLEKNKNIENLLGKEISSSIGGNFSVGRVKVGLFSLYLENATINLATHYYAVSIRDIKISFSLFKLIRSHWNIGRSISKIIFINPQLDIFLKNARNGLSSGIPEEAPAPEHVAKSDELYSIINQFPVDQFLIRKGVVRIFGNQQESVSIGDELSGSIRNDAAGLYCELRGNLASRKKNLFISGIFSRKYHRNHVSVRLDKANIGKPIRWGAFEIRSGTLDGTCEFSFPNKLTIQTFESAGWVHIGNADVVADGVKNPITSANLAVSLNNTLLRIDSAGCVWNGMAVKGSGRWDAVYEHDSGSGISLECEGARMESLFPKADKAILEKIHGIGWAKALITKRPLTADKALSITGGISLAGLPLLLSAKALWARNQISVDSWVIRGPGVWGAGSGIVNFEKSMPVYSASYSLRADSLPQNPALRGSGRLYAHGSLRGLGSKTYVETHVGGENVHVLGVNIGNPDIAVTTDNFNRISFDVSDKNAPFLCGSGTLDSLLSNKPRFHAAMNIGAMTINSFLGGNNTSVVRALDSPWISGAITLVHDRFELQGLAGMRSKFGHGIIRFFAEKNPESRTFFWRVSQQQLFVGDSTVALTARGSFNGSILSIDSVVGFGGLRGSGRFDAEAKSLDATVHYHDIPLGALNTWLLRRQLPIKSGSISGNTRITGVHGRISTDSELHLRRAGLGYFTNIDADAVLRSKDTVVTLLPMTIRKDNLSFISLDTISNNKGIIFSGRFINIPIRSLAAPEPAGEEAATDDYGISGLLSGEFKSVAFGLPISVSAGCPTIFIGKWRMDSVLVRCLVGAQKVDIQELSASDAGRSSIICAGCVPWDVLTNEHANDDSLTSPDSMDLRIKVSGDLLASLEKNVGEPFGAPIAGTGKGALEFQIKGTPGNVRIFKARGGIPHGTLRIKPYVHEDIKDFSLSVNTESDTTTSGLDSSLGVPRITIDMNGTIGKRPIRICTVNKIPDGFESLRLGFMDFGIIQVSTPKGGVDLHIPGLMEPGNTIDVDFGPKPPVKAFTISGPVDRLRITGTWVLRSGEFTYPMLKHETASSSFDPLPYVYWDLDLKSVNRKIKYFYDASAKNRRILRLVECYIDPNSTLSIRGREKEHTLKLLGALRSSKGSVFFRKVFELNFEAGLDFTPQPLMSGNGFDNRPIIWGSAEAPSDKNRFDRTKITLVTRDSVTGALSEKGRFYGLRFKVSSDVGETPGEPDENFLTSEGKRVATSVEGAGELVSTIGEQYLHRFLLQNLENRLAKSLGLDVITFETSIASNYFNKIYNRQVVNLSYDWNYLAFANVGITFGRYIFYDKVFLKWRTEMVPVETLIRPEYTMGFEFQPLNYFMMDFDYGMRQGQKSLEQNPKVYMQLRLPIESVRKYLKF